MIGRIRQIQSRGFTIIELLIVIVVIGILALLVLNTFSGIQERARNTQRITTARAWAQAVSLYIVDNADYPPSPVGFYCAGIGYDNLGGSSSGDCRAATTTTSFTSERSNTMEALRPYVGDTSIESVDPVIFGSHAHYGPVMALGSTLEVDGVSNAYILFYALEGAEQDCGLSALSGSSWGNWSSIVPNPGNYTNSDPAADSTRCIIELARP